MNNQVSTILNKLTVREKASLVSGKEFWYTEPIDRLGIKSIMMTDGPSGLRKQADTSDALGLNKSVEAVSFPVSALTASSFDRALLTQLGKHLGIAAKANDVAVLLGPGINMKRSPLAGRNFEYFSEDPLVAGELGSAYVNGVQSENVGVSLKHFAANNRENQRFTVSSDMDERTLREIYLSAFENVVKNAHPATLMCSYNSINGSLNSENKWLLTKILRDEWDFQGLVMSDWGAVADHVRAIKAGLDLEMPGKGKSSINEIVDAVESGMLAESELDKAARRVLNLIHTYSKDSNDAVNYQKEEQHEFARKTAEQSMILLKNEDQVLPLKSTDTVGVVGELAAKPRYQGGGSSHVNAFKVTTPLSVVQQINPDYQYAQGYTLKGTDTKESLSDEAIELAKNVNKVIVFAGLPEEDESEGFDKVRIDLPENQNELIKKLSEVNPNIVVVLQNGSAVTMPWIKNVKGVLETYLAGEAVGEATWNILNGVVNPSGKLAESFPLSIKDTPTYGTFDVNEKHEKYREGLYVGYRYYDMKQIPVLFPFGYGLSYTTFKYAELKIKELEEQQVEVRFKITNTGNQAGQEIAQIYVRNRASYIEKPFKELRGFTKVELNTGETKEVAVTLSRRAFSWYNEQTSSWQVDNGNYEILIGKSSADIELQSSLTLNWSTNDKPIIDRDTYFANIIARKDLAKALAESGLDKLMGQLQSSAENAQLLENIPLRSAVMLGASSEQVDKFIKLANQ
ncbi:beta-glucosidase [Oenococcus oeni]|uniref:beta-glucosidase n=1 Tax=Oenococcus oeni TaxID=1247 RepID=UPI00051054E5|nr:glycoside hydrolase family 3 C-terminal domain-containing protein [Oenococcus oeni]KGI00487.1 glycosyl hydrolase family 3 [Oenococcus oeni IOEB_C52]